MPRHPNQNAALDHHHKDRKDQTRQALLDAMERLLRGEPLFTDGELTEANLYREAKRSRATLNRYPEIKRRFCEAKNHCRENSAIDKDERIRELEEMVRRLQREENRMTRELKESRDRLAQEVYVLNLLIEQMRKKSDQAQKRSTGIVVSLIGIKPIIKCVSHRSCEQVETRPSLSGIGEKFFLDFSSLDKSPEFAYENTSFDYEFVSQPHDG